MQLPKSIKLQMSGAVLSRRSRKVALRYNKSKKIYSQKNTRIPC